jgi:hypothetical protein
VGFALTLTGCQPQPPAPPVSVPAAAVRYATLNPALAKGGLFAEHSFYACLVSGLAQDLPLVQVVDACAGETVGDFDTDNRPDGGLWPGADEPFDPDVVAKNCAAGDPVRGREPVREYKGSDVRPGTRVAGVEGYGYGSYGGAGEKTPDGKKEYVGLTQAESMKQKADAIDLAERAKAAKDRIQAELNREKDPGRRRVLQQQLDEAQVLWDQLHSEAYDDPNIREPLKPNFRPSPDASGCEEAVQAVRNVLRECHRNGWKSQRCQNLAAKMNHCPDPMKSYVDPDAGYRCGATFDAAAVRDAWVRRCQSIVRYGPDAQNPCVPPTVDDAGRYVKGDSRDICSDPRALIDPASGACVAPLTLDPVGPDIDDIIVVALDKIGGPNVVIPRNPNPSPRPGPDPGPK